MRDYQLENRLVSHEKYLKLLNTHLNAQSTRINELVARQDEQQALIKALQTKNYDGDVLKKSIKNLLDQLASSNNDVRMIYEIYKMTARQGNICIMPLDFLIKKSNYNTGE